MSGEGGGSGLKKFFGAVLILLVIAGAVTALVFPELWRERLGLGGPPEGRRVQCEELGISIAIPEGWTSELRSVGTPTLIASNPPGDSVRVTFQRAPAGADPEKFARERLKALFKKTYKEREAAAVTLAGASARKLVASGGKPGAVRVSLLYVLPRGERTYTVHGSTKAERFEAEKAALEAIAESLRFEAAAK